MRRLVDFVSSVILD